MTLLSLLCELADQEPGAVAAIDASPDPVVITRAELRRRSLGLAAELQRVGVGRGDCVAVWLPNWSSALCWQLGVTTLGGHVIGVNTRYNVDELSHVLEQACPTVLAIAHDFHGLDLLGTLRKALPHVTAPRPRVAVVPAPGEEPPVDVAAYDIGSGAWTCADPSGEPAVPAEAATGAELAVAFTTSGSTGKPKLAAHKEAAVAAHALDDVRALDLHASDVVLCALPLSGVFGFNTAMAALAGGACCVLEPVFTAETVLEHMARFGVTHVVGGDDMVGRLADAWQRTRHELSAWRWLGMADFVGRSTELADWAMREFGTVTTGVYGSSEVFALAASWPPEEPAPRRWMAGGRPVSPRIRVRATDPASGRVVAPGEQGELQFRGPNVVDAYLGGDVPMARSFTEDGWFRSGDLGVVRADGSFEFVCRMGDALRLKGFLVDPAEIEHRLAEHEAVLSAKVVGAPGVDGETRAIGFVVLHGTAEPGDLRAWCATTLAKFKVPEVIHVLDEMPTTSGTNGTKIKTATLRDWARKWTTP